MRLFDPSYTVADIFRSHFDKYLQQFGPVPKHYYTVVNAMMRCRTEALGGHIYTCDSCSHEITLYNSCGNRHCTVCQALTRAKWVEKRTQEALPIQYYHVVFTLPHQLNPIVLRNRKIMYKILFKAVEKTLLALGKDPKYLGGELGFILVLHTWGQNLMDHPHIHCIIPAGALDSKNNTWRSAPKNFLFPVAVMSKLFRGKFMDSFRKAVRDGKINPLQVATPQFPCCNDLVNKLFKITWVTNVKEPFESPTNLIKYLARYTHRIAISNHRIITVQNDQVTFSYKDYADNDKIKQMTLSAVEFIRRFMMHVLPDGFMRMRHYGFLGNKAKKKKLPLIRTLIEQSGSTDSTRSIENEEKNPNPVEDPWLCPLCKKGALRKDREVKPAIKEARTLVVND